MEKSISIKKISVLALFVSIALILGYIESLFPVYIPVPGAKMGLANIVTMILLFHFGFVDALIVTFLRIFITGITFTNIYMMLYSLAGGFLSLIVMFIFMKTNLFSKYIISILGGIFHNIGQLFVAMIFFDTTTFLYYLPYLIILGTLSGFLMGMLTILVDKKIGSYLKQIN